LPPIATGAGAGTPSYEPASYHPNHNRMDLLS
jgi:hypothetical protein